MQQHWTPLSVKYRRLKKKMGVMFDNFSQIS